MKTFKAFFIVLIIVLFISSAKSQWIPCQGIEGANCNSIITQDSFLFIDGPGGIFRRQIDDPMWDTACLIGGYWNIRSTGNALFCLGPMGLLYRSLDNGLTWEEDLGPDPDYEYINIKAIDSVIFLDFYSDHLIKTSDNGESWIDIYPSPLTASTESIYSQQGILFCFLQNIDTLYRSDDYGLSWTTYPLTGIPEIGDPYFYNNQLWLASGNRFYIYDNTLAEWIIQKDTLPAIINEIHFIEDSEALCSYTNHGFFKYYPQDSVWKVENQGLESLQCWDACRDGNTIYLATSSGPFSKTGVNPWVPQYDDLFGISVSKVFEVGNRIFALANGKIFYSDDIDNGFEPFNSQGYCPGEVIITDSAWYEGSGCGFAISLDSGQIWTTYNEGIEGHGVTSIAISDQYYFAEINQTYGLARTRIDSISWERVPNELENKYITDLEVINNTLFAVVSQYDYSLYKSDDYGTTFMAVPETGNYIRQLYVKNDKIFVLSQYNDVIYSDDSGETWNTWIYNAENLDFTSIDMTDDENTTVLGGSNPPWISTSIIFLYSPGFTQGFDITDNLPTYLWSYISEILIYNGGIFACPSSGGLWYRDDLMVGVDENDFLKPSSSAQLSIYPNPASTFLHIQLKDKSEQYEYQVIDYSGKMMMKGIIENGMTDFSIDVSALSGGLYLLVIKDDASGFISAKFLK